MTRVMGQLDEAQQQDLARKAMSLAEGTPIDVSPGTRRQSGPGQVFLSRADDILLRDDAGINTAVNKLLAVVSNFDLERGADERPTRESLARLLKSYTEIVAAV